MAGSEGAKHEGEPPKRNPVGEPAANYASNGAAGLGLQASALIPTAYGPFETHVFRGVSTTAGDVADHVVLTRGRLQGRSEVPLRVHSECMTSEVFGSLKCDCADQLAHAQRHISEAGHGLIVYLRQEGRGIGLAAKLQAYALQSQGADTVDANRQLGLPDDTRCYDIVASVLAAFGVQSVRLMTNNPDKLEALRALGVRVDGVLPVVTGSNPHSAGYLEAKRRRMGHWLPAQRTLRPVGGLTKERSAERGTEDGWSCADPTGSA